MPITTRASIGLSIVASFVSLLDHLIRPRQQRRRDRQAERLGGLEVDDQLELGGLLDRKVSRLRPLENAIDIARHAPVHVREAYAVGHEAAVADVFSELVHGRQTVARSQVDEKTPVCVEEGARQYV